MLRGRLQEEKHSGESVGGSVRVGRSWPGEGGTHPLTHFEPPEGVAGVGTPVEKAAGFGPGTQQVFGRKALGLRNVPNLSQRKSQL